MGEVGDKLSSATVNDLNAKFDDAKTQKDQKGNGVELIKALMSKIGGGGGGSDGQNVEQDLENVEKIRKNAVHINPYELSGLFCYTFALMLILLLVISITAEINSPPKKYRKSLWTSSGLETIFSRVSRFHHYLWGSQYYTEVAGCC